MNQRLIILVFLCLLSVTAMQVLANDSLIDEVEPLQAPPTDDEDMDDDDDDYDDDEMPPARPGEQVLNSVKWSAPNLSDEEAHSTRLPSNLKCDGCTAVAYQIALIVGAFHQQKWQKKGKLAPESDVIDLFDKICSKPTFENYGLKLYNGENRLSGPGTEAVDEPGMMQGGGRWPYRLFTMCGEIVGEADEYEIYKFIAENGNGEVKQFLCENPEESELNSCGDIKGGQQTHEEL